MQVEALAEAFSHLPAISRLPWQARLSLFQIMELQSMIPDHNILLAKNKVTVTNCSAPSPVEANDPKDATAQPADASQIASGDSVPDAPPASSIDDDGSSMHAVSADSVTVVTGGVAVVGGRPIESPRDGLRPPGRNDQHHEAHGGLGSWDPGPEGSVDHFPLAVVKELPRASPSKGGDQQTIGRVPTIPKGYEGYDLQPPNRTPRSDHDTLVKPYTPEALPLTSRTSSTSDDLAATAVSEHKVPPTEAPLTAPVPRPPSVVAIQQIPQQLRSSASSVKVDKRLFFVIWGTVSASVTLADSSVPWAMQGHADKAPAATSAKAQPETLQEFGIGSSFSSDTVLSILCQKDESSHGPSQLGIGSYTQELSVSTENVAEVLCISQTLYDMAVNSRGKIMDEEPALCRYVRHGHPTDRAFLHLTE